MANDLRALIVRVTYGGDVPPRTLHVGVTEYARVGNDRTIEVIRRGWSGSPDFFDQDLDAEIVEMKQNARHCLLPANAEETGEEQDWWMIQQKLKRYGVNVSIEELREAPVMIEIEERLIQMIMDLGRA